MLKSFKHKGLEQFFIKDNKKFLDAKDLTKITRILDRLDTAVLVKDMGLVLARIKRQEKRYLECCCS
jgi:toxin HigB-1